MSIKTVTLRSTVVSSSGVTGYNYRAVDHLGKSYNWPTVFRPDGAFDAEAYKATVAAELEAQLAQREIDKLLEE